LAAVKLVEYLAGGSGFAGIFEAIDIKQ